MQMVCAEIDVVTKSFCKEIDASFKGDKINHYCKKITTEYTVFPKDSVRLLLCKIDLNPWAGWTFVDKVTKNGNNKVDSQNPLWWKDHNEIKHDRTSFKDGKQNYKKANQNNIINALAALFQMEMYFYNRLADNENLKEKTPLPKSRLFSIPRWTDTVIDGNEILFKDDCCALLNEMLIKAVKCRYIDFNVMDAIEYKKHKKKKGQAFTREQEERFVQACQSNYRGVALLVALYCGLRRGELLGLTTDDIHLEERYISINKQFQNGKIVPPKTDSGIRNVPILDNLYPYLKDMDLSKHERLFPIKEHALREHFQNALKASGLYGQGFTLHSLRHTFITRCAENKVSSAVAQKWAGHSSADMTQNVYTHVNEDFEKEEIAKFNKGVNDTYNQEKKTIRE